MSKWLETIKKHIDSDKSNLYTSCEANVQLVETLQEENNTQCLIRCLGCNKLLTELELVVNNKVCNCCNYHFRINSIERMKLIFEESSIELFDENIVSCNPIKFPNYDEKLDILRKTLGIKEAVITGKGNILNQEVYFGIMDYRFILGSMGSVVGEKLTRMIERASEENKPIVIFSASGGARMQEGMISLYQMAKVVAAIEKHNEKGLLYISVLTDPTMGGVFASYASIADIIIAEPNAVIGFAGKRVIENIIKEKIPNNFQTSEFQMENGHVDIICERKKLKNTISNIITLYTSNKNSSLNEIKFREVDIKNIYNSTKVNLSAWDKVKLARDKNRPNYSDYINNIFDSFIELHGDRICNDDKAIITGIGYINDIAITAIFNAKGKNLNENIIRNFGMARPEGYRKVGRITKLAEKFNLPVICFINTLGAYCGVDAEKLGQGEAIASSIKNFTKLTVPIISIITGEGGSGGALAIGVADWIFALENSVYSVISPEGCASILFKDSTKAEESSEYLKLTSDELLKLNIVDEIIPEYNREGKVDDKSLIYYCIKLRLHNKLIELLNIEKDKLVDKRYNKFRKHGVFKEL